MADQEKQATPPDNGCDECHYYTEANGVRSYCPECWSERDE